MAYNDRQVEDKLLEGVRARLEQHKVKITAETIEVDGEERRVFALDCDDMNAMVRPMVGVDKTISSVECGLASITEAVEHTVERLIAAMDVAAEYMLHKCDEIITEDNLKSGRVTFVLVGKEGNAEMLETVPHGQFLDLVYMYRLIAENGSYALITNQHVEKYGLDAEKLYERAMEGTRENMTVANLESTTIKMAVSLGDDEAVAEMENWSKEHPDKIPMFFIGNADKGSGGAAAMMFPDIMDAACVLCGCPDIYILPSSLDEVLAIPILDTDDIERDREFLKKTIRDINTSMVIEQGKVLSYSLYQYNYETKKFKVW